MATKLTFEKFHDAHPIELGKNQLAAKCTIQYNHFELIFENLLQVQQFLLTLELDGLLPKGVRISSTLASALSADSSRMTAVSAAVRARASAAGDTLDWKGVVDLASDCLVGSACSFSGEASENSTQ